MTTTASPTDPATPAKSPKLTVKVHEREPHAANSFMIGNAYGAVFGGNLQMYMYYGEAGPSAYPTRFKSRRTAEFWLLNNAAYVAEIERVTRAKIKESKQ